MTMLMSGCQIGNKDIVVSKTLSNKQVFKIEKSACGLKEAKVYLTNYQNIYGKAYTIDLWQHDFGDDSLEDYVMDITLEELYEAIPQISKVPMSMKLLKSTVELTSFVKNFDDNEMVATYEDELTFMDPVYEEIIVGFIAKLRPIERFIFLQNYEYCADKYVHLTTKELGSVREFVELCKQDKLGKKHICWEGCRECVEDKFIRNQRDSVRNRFRDTILKADMNAEDLSGKLEELMMREWHKLEKEMN